MHNFPAQSTKIITLSSVFALLLTGVVAFAPISALAQQPLRLQTEQTGQTGTDNTDRLEMTAIPPRLGDDGSLKAAPGEKLQTSVRIRNGSDKVINISTLAEDFIIDVDGETPIPVTDTVNYRWSLQNWVVLSPNFQVLQPGETATVNVIIEVPVDALPGGHYAMITHKPVDANGNDLVATNEAASKINQRVGTLVYLVVDGPINEEAFIRDFKFPGFTEYGPVPFEFSVDNQSDIHIRPEVKVEIFNLLGMKVDTIQVPSKNVFPMVGRKFADESQAWDRVWGAGYYRARLTMAYGSGGQIAIAQTSFWLLPITLIAAILVGILAVSAIAITIRRHRMHAQSEDKIRMKALQDKIDQLEGTQSHPTQE